MKKSRTVTIVETFCDICGQLCHSNYTTVEYNDGTEKHACNEFDETKGKTCREIMEDQLRAEAKAAHEASRQENP